MRLRILTLLFLFTQIYAIGQQTVNGTLIHDGVIRNYMLYLPTGLAAENAPLVFNLHGYTSNANEQMFYSNMNAVAENNGFAVCYPNGTQDVQGVTHWNANLNISTTDDVGFLVALAQELQEEYQFDAERTYSCGMSNGGFMSYTLACEAPEVFKAVASVTGTMNSVTFENCDPSSVVPVLEIHGTADQTVPYDGAEGVIGWGDFMATDTVIDFWVSLNDCMKLDEMDLDDVNMNDGSTVTSFKYSDCATGNQVWLYKVHDGGHDWPGTFFGNPNRDFNASEKIWEFFSLANTLTNVEEPDQKEVRIFPNPTDGQIFLQNYEEIQALELLNMNGQMIQNLSPAASLDISTHNAGVYFLRIQTKDNQLSLQKVFIF